MCERSRTLSDVEIDHRKRMNNACKKVDLCARIDALGTKLTLLLLFIALEIFVCILWVIR